MIDEHDDIELNCSKNMETTEQIKMIEYRNISLEYIEFCEQFMNLTFFTINNRHVIICGCQ